MKKPKKLTLRDLKKVKGGRLNSVRETWEECEDSSGKSNNSGKEGSAVRIASK